MNMSKTNCPNCGAALDIFKPKCEFCGTRNINLTDIDLDSNEPANFIFKLPRSMSPIEDANVYINILAIPELTDLTMTASSVEAYNGWSRARLATWNNDKTLNLGINLRAISQR